MQSQFDQDELARITWQRLKPVCKADVRITQDQIKNLRSCGEANQPNLFRFIHSLFVRIKSLLPGFIHDLGIKNNYKEATNCELYGHVLSDASWSGKLPVCGECGAGIKSSLYLRSSLNQHLLSQRSERSQSVDVWTR
jgi:hypothetical protein